MRKKILAFVFAVSLSLAMALPLVGGVSTASAHAVPTDIATPGAPNCHGKIVSEQAKEHGGTKKASQDPSHAFESVKEYQKAIKAYCAG